MLHLALRLALLSTAVCSVNVAVLAGSPWGTLKGTFVYDGIAPKPVALNIPPATLGDNPNPVDETLLVDANGGIQNIVVFVRTKNIQVHPRALKDTPKEVVLESKGCRFEPHILTITTTQTLLIRNSDGFGINANVMDGGGKGFNPLLLPNSEVKYRYGSAQAPPQPVTSNIQPWYKAYVLPRNNPYFAVSKTDGTFEIHGLPLGRFEFQVWHEKPGFLDTNDWPKGRFEFEIKPGDNDLGRIKLDPAIFK